mgnify:CR=1 FL=1
MHKIHAWPIRLVHCVRLDVSSRRRHTRLPTRSRGLGDVYKRQVLELPLGNAGVGFHGFSCLLICRATRLFPTLTPTKGIRGEARMPLLLFLLLLILLNLLCGMKSYFGGTSKRKGCGSVTVCSDWRNSAQNSCLANKISALCAIGRLKQNSFS